jgi:preprotein translocase subunit YajC
MPGLLFDWVIPIFAAKPAPAAGGGEGISMFVTLLPVILLFYLLILRPQQQQEKKRRQMVEALKKNDRVLTTAGIYGTVVSVDAGSDKVVVRVDDDRGVKLVFSRASVARVVDPATEKPAPAPEATT